MHHYFEFLTAEFVLLQCLSDEGSSALNAAIEAGLLPRDGQEVFINQGENEKHRVLETIVKDCSDTEPSDKGIHFQSKNARNAFKLQTKG